MISIYQNFYREDQRNRLDPAFISYDNSTSNVPEYYEFGPLLDLYESKKYLDAEYTGIVSYKFNRKTGISGTEIKDFIVNNPGYDVYFINPHPYLAYCYYNAWDQGECWHRGLKEVASIVLKELGIVNNIDNVPRHSMKNLCYANFWVGNQWFWSKYGEIMISLKKLINENVEIKSLLFEDTFHANDSAPLFPFLFERLFSTILSVNQNISYLAFPYSDDELFKSCFYEYEAIALKENKSLIDSLDDTNDFNSLRSFFDQSSSYFCEKTKKLLTENGIPLFLQ